MEEFKDRGNLLSFYAFPLNSHQPMSLTRYSWQHLFKPLLYKITMSGIAIVLAAVLLNFPASAQGTPRIIPPWINNLSTVENIEVASAPVRLDGRDLFILATPITQQSDQLKQTPLKARITGIETNLKRWVSRAADELNITAAIDSQSNLPIVTINQQYLMTVTTLDAELQGQSPIAYANQLTTIIRNALIQAKQERTTSFLSYQTLVTIALLFTGLLLRWGLNRIQKQLRQQQTHIQAKISPLTHLPSDNSDSGAQTRLRVQQQLDQREQYSVKVMQRRILQIVQLSSWAVIGFIILGLFPSTRELQPFLLSTPLTVIGVILMTYILMRITDVLIDRLFKAFEIQDTAPLDAPQRLALRVVTFSRVMKSLTTIGWGCLGGIVILSVIGIQIVPLLAGAGLVGLGISLASQSLIKDVINGCLILFEDQYAVGDVIRVGTVSGLVEYLSLRSTRIRSTEGNLITLPNSTISVVENLSKEWSRVDLAIAVSYEVDIDHAIEVVNQVGQVMLHDPHWQSKILEPPDVLGVDDLNNIGITLRIWIKTQPLQQWNVARDFRRRLKITFDQQGIPIGIPQQSLSVRGTLDERFFEEHRRNDA
jgi:moderate conductance mechanosensitive channel